MRFVGAVHRGRRRGPRRPAPGAGDPRHRDAVPGVGGRFRWCSSPPRIEVPAPVAALIAFVPAVAMVQVLPISLSGLGVREGMLVLFLARSACRATSAIGLGLMWYASLLIVSVLGAPAFAAGKRKRMHTAAHDANTPTTGRHRSHDRDRTAHHPHQRAAPAHVARRPRVLQSGHVIYWWGEIIAILALLRDLHGDPQRHERRHSFGRSQHAQAGDPPRAHARHLPRARHPRVGRATSGR